MVNGHSGSTPWHAKGFPANKLEKHFHDHAKELKLKSRSEYNNAAVTFMNKKPNANIDYFVDSRGTLYKFDRKSKEFGIADVNGNIITYFIPHGDAEKYWYEQVDKYDDETKL